MRAIKCVTIIKVCPALMNNCVPRSQVIWRDAAGEKTVNVGLVAILRFAQRRQAAAAAAAARAQVAASAAAAVAAAGGLQLPSPPIPAATSLPSAGETIRDYNLGSVLGLSLSLSRVGHGSQRSWGIDRSAGCLLHRLSPAPAAHRGPVPAADGGDGGGGRDTRALGYSNLNVNRSIAFWSSRVTSTVRTYSHHN